MRPLGIDLFAGLGGWTEGLLAENFQVIGFDIEKHEYGDHKYPAQLVIQDVLTLHGSQFKDAALIVASPPCQEYSYMAMPWSLAKAKRSAYRRGDLDVADLTRLFDACFRIQREAIEAAGRHIPLVVENVRGAQEWVGRSRWNFGSFHLWGDVPALMPMTVKYAVKAPGQNWSRFKETGEVSPDWKFQGVNPDGRNGIPHQPTGHWTNPAENGTKQGGDWFNASQPSISNRCSSKSKARKAASAMIAKIPLELSRHIARSWA